MKITVNPWVRKVYPLQAGDQLPGHGHPVSGVSCQGGAKDQERKNLSEGPVRQISRYEVTKKL